jgi:hypothetical protein
VCVSFSVNPHWDGSSPFVLIAVAQRMSRPRVAGPIVEPGTYLAADRLIDELRLTPYDLRHTPVSCTPLSYVTPLGLRHTPMSYATIQ